jgi:hypothetical protein
MGTMESNSGYHEKMDALDLVINALKDHEKRLDDISHKLERVFKEVTAREPRRVRGGEEEKQVEAPPPKQRPLVVCKKWSEFKDRGTDAEMVAFEVEENRFQVYAVVRGDVFQYAEELPGTRIKVREAQSSFSVDKAAIKNIDLFQFLIDGRLQCALGLQVKISRSQVAENEYLFELSYDLSADEVKAFLSRELGVSQDKIVEGRITYS